METLRFVGNCQGCGADHKLRSNLLVHHGYLRPGHGEIVGDCMAVGEPPYELSCAWTKDRLVFLEGYLVRTREHLATLPEATLLRVAPLYFGAEMVTYVLGVAEPYLWSQVLDRKVRETEMEIEAIVREITYRKERIAAWVLAHVREVNEESIQAEQRTAQAQRAEDRRKVREEKQAKADALKLKQAARAAERQGVLDGFAVKFRELADLPEGPDRATKASALSREAEKRKHQRFGRWDPSDLGCDDALVKLGLAHKYGERGDGSPLYTYDITTPWR